MVQAGQEETQSRFRPSQWGLAAFVIVGALGSIVYRVLHDLRFEQTSALFIGLPALLAIGLAFTATPKTATGIVMKGITFFLLLSGALLAEGFICIIMAAPIFYVVGLVLAIPIDWYIRRARTRGSRVARSLVLLPVLLMSFEGTHENLSFSRDEEVTVERVVDGTPAEVEQSLAARPRFYQKLPIYLRLGFPRPITASGEGLEPGDRRVIRFAGGEGKPGDYVLEVVEHRPGYLRFRSVSDDSHIAHWLEWKDAIIRWEEVEPGRTKVSWTVQYRRLLDPAWYFGPWERYAAGCAAEYLIDTMATPR